MTTVNPDNRVPAILADQILSGRCILLLGSGSSAEAGAPVASQLAKELADRYLEGRHSDEPLARVAAYLENKPGLGRRVLVRYIVDRLSNLSPSKAHLELARYPWGAIYTTNYDDLVERAYGQATLGRRQVTRILRSSDLSMEAETPRPGGILLLKPHGCVTNPYSEDVPLVISEDDFMTAAANRVAILRLLELHKYTNTFLFIGYSFGDPDLTQIWGDVASELGRLSQWGYAVWPGCSQEQREVWNHRYIQLIDCTMSRFFTDLAEWASKSPDQLEQLPGKAFSSLIPLLAAVMEARDPAPSYDGQKLAQLVELVGMKMGLLEGELRDLAAAAFTHDIGKVGVPDQILHKPGPLTEAEWDALRNHPIIGERILSAVPGLGSLANIVRSHHERWDGTGYPDGLSGDNIPIATRILSAAEMFLVLLSNRPYRPSYGVAAALEAVKKEAGKAFDPGVVHMLVDLIRANKVKQIRWDP